VLQAVISESTHNSEKSNKDSLPPSNTCYLLQKLTSSENRTRERKVDHA